MKNIIFLLMFIFLSVVNSEVNYRSGNYYLEMMEFIIPTGGNALEIKRVYNSRSLYMGAFGFGWSFNFDIKIIALPGGRAIIVDEDGRKIWLSVKKRESYLKKDIENLKKATNNLRIGKKIRKMSDPEKVGKFFESNKVKPHIPANTIYYGYTGWRGYETIKRLKKGWIRTIGHSGKKQIFDLNGRLIKLVDQYGNYVMLKYKQGKLFQITNPFNETATFYWNSSNLIKSIKALDKKMFIYTYGKHGTLRTVKHPKFGVTKFFYNKLYNLEKIIYPTGDTKVLTYDNKLDMVTSEKGPGILNVRYSYGVDPRDKKHYWTIISVPYGKKFKTIDRWEYWEDKNKYLRVKDGSKVITKFSKFGSGSPEYINRDGKITRFKYNSKGQAALRILPDGTRIETEFDPRLGKPNKVKDGKDIYYYIYNSRGNIVKATNNHGLKVNIEYDKRGRIKILKSKKKGTLHFNFNEMAKPTKIVKKGVGTVNIWYDTEGRITKIKTKPKGGKIATVIISTFTELFGLLKYAGM